MKSIIFSVFLAVPIAIGIQQLPSKVDGTALNIPICNTATEKLHWNGTDYSCVIDATGSGGAGESIPVGSILIIESGSCPTGYTETLNGKFILGTLAANGDIGSNGGSDSIVPSGSISVPSFTGNSVSTSAISAGTPAGTISTPTFTGTALTAHAHELPFQIPTSTSIRQTASFGSGTSRAATATITTTSNTTSAAVALSQAVSAGTPSGTVSTPTFTGSALGTHSHTVTATGTISQLSFTGASQENRPSFTKVIFCKKS